MPSNSDTSGDSSETQSTRQPEQTQQEPEKPESFGVLPGGKREFLYHPDEYCEWGAECAVAGEKVTMRVFLPDLPGEKEGKISVHERDADGNDDVIEENIPVKLVDGTGSTTWTMRYVDDSDDFREEDYVGELDDEADDDETDPKIKRWSSPEFYFKVECEGKKGLSPILQYVENLELEIVDAAGEKVTGVDYIAVFSDGTERRGKISEGWLRLKKVPPLSFILNIEGYTDISLD